MGAKELVDRITEIKDKANKYYSRGHFFEAEQRYTHAIDKWKGQFNSYPYPHVLYSNRAAARISLYQEDVDATDTGSHSSSENEEQNTTTSASSEDGEGFGGRRAPSDQTRSLKKAERQQSQRATVPALLQSALEDAQACQTLAPDFRRGYLREAKVLVLIAQRSQQLDFEAMADCIESALQAGLMDISVSSSAPMAPDATQLITHCLLQAARAKLAALGHMRCVKALGTAASLACVQCGGTLLEPVTMGDGDSLCLHCVGTYIQAHPSAVVVGFGQKVNVLLKKVTKLLEPKQTQAAELRGEGATNMLRHQEDLAQANLDAAIEFAPHDVLGWLQRSELQLLREDPAAALHDINRALALDPTHPLVNRQSGLTLLRLGHTQKAVVAFSFVVAKDQAYLPEMVTILQQLVREGGKESLSAVLDSSDDAATGSPSTRASSISNPSTQSSSSSTETQGSSADEGRSPFTASSSSSGPSYHTEHPSSSPSPSLPPSSPSSPSRASANQRHSSLLQVHAPKRKASSGEVSGALKPRERDGKRQKRSKTKKSANDELKLVLHAIQQYPDMALVRPPPPTPVAKEVLEELREELDCPLCYNMLCFPGTLPCGHSLCRPCIARTLDHSFDKEPQCPVCRANLVAYLCWTNEKAVNNHSARWSLSHGARHIVTNKLLNAFLVKHYPQLYEERKAEVKAQEASEGGGQIPIFVSMLAFPLVPCSLHIFEPRHRLMMRRVVDSGHQRFGMCLPLADGAPSDYGCVVRITSFEQLPDGRALVEVVGCRRFKILDRGERDGYCVAKVEWVTDTLDNLGEASDPDGKKESKNEQGQDVIADSNVANTTKQALTKTEEDEEEMKLIQELRKKGSRVLDRLPLVHRFQILSHIGEIPAKARGVTFWVLAMLPLPNAFKYDLLYGEETRYSSLARTRRVHRLLNRFLRGPARPAMTEPKDPMLTNARDVCSSSGSCGGGDGDDRADVNDAGDGCQT